MNIAAPIASPSAASLFGDYKPLTKIFDEAAARTGERRDHWKEFVSAFDQLGAEELTARKENARRIIRENGVTYNVYGDPLGMDRPWELDMLPLLISPAEWRVIEEGVVQRARLLNAILQDIYGPQRLLREGLLPPALVFGNPGFLRSCHGLNVPQNTFLHFHAVDLARSPDGQWWALADRTQAPSGAGYALENRIVLSRVLQDEFRDLHVHRLAQFFSVFRETLRKLAPNRSNPKIVLLTPGPHNETYFEHSYLARYLGFTLVEGGDLTVRERKVFIKTLEGLQPVDVILRRVDDVFCDPLELRGDSFLGVAGLIEAARAGNIVIANALGASILESPAFLAFLPTLCQRLLGEELKLPSVATWWCGQSGEQKYVLERLDKIVVKSAFGRVSSLPFFGKGMSADEREDLVNAIGERPFEFVGQEQVAFSTAPAWINSKLEPRGVVLRAFAAASGDGSYVAMPGGLTRISADAGSPVVSMQSGGGSKDTWVLADEAVPIVSLLTDAGQPTPTTQAHGELTSRVADNLYWLGRYAERLEASLRLLRTVLARMTEDTAPDSPTELPCLLKMLAEMSRIPSRFAERVPFKELEQEILQLVYSARRTGSVRELVLRIRHVASTVRDRFSNDTWRILNQLQADSRTRPGRLPFANALALINTLITDLAAFSGMEMENMTRGHSWRFLDLGRRLERAQNLLEYTSAALEVDGDSGVVLPPLLELADSSMTYRRRYFAQPRMQPVLQLLLADATNPRSLAFQVGALLDHVTHLPKDPTLGRQIEPGSLRTIAEHALAFEKNFGSQQWLLGKNESLRHWLQNCSDELVALSDQLTEQYFSVTTPEEE